MDEGNNEVNYPSNKHFVGKWKIIRCIPESLVSNDVDALTNCVFELHPNYEVKWHPPSSAASTASTASASSSASGGQNPTANDPPTPFRHPLFKTTSYVLRKKTDNYSSENAETVHIKFAAHNGNTVSFKIVFRRYLEDNGPLELLLGFQHWFGLLCQCQGPVEVDSGSTECTDTPFHFLPAMREELFPDKKGFVHEGKTYRLHKNIFKCSVPEFPWEDERSTEELFRSLLNGADGVGGESCLQLLLHYLYSHSLPKDASVKEVSWVQAHLRERPGFKPFCQLAAAYVRKRGLQQNIVRLVSEFHGAMNAIILEFGGDPSRDMSQETLTEAERAMAAAAEARKERAFARNKRNDATYMIVSIKQALKHALIAMVKFSHAVHLLHRPAAPGRDLGDMSDDVEHDERAIYRYLCHSMSVVQTQVRGILLNVHASANLYLLDMETRQQLAGLILPELENTSNPVLAIYQKLQDIFSEIKRISGKNVIKMITETRKRLERDNNCVEYPEIRDMTLMLEEDDQKMLFVISRYLMAFQFPAFEPSSDFTNRELSEKIFLLSQMIDSVVLDELPVLLQKYDIVTETVKIKMDKGEGKMFFNIVKTLVDKMLQWLRDCQPDTSSLMQQLGGLIQSRTLNSSLRDMGLLPKEPPSSSQEAAARDDLVGEEEDVGDLTDLDYASLFESDYELDLCHSLCRPPPASQSKLAERVAEMSASWPTDLTVVVHGAEADEEGSEGRDKTSTTATEKPCHKLVLAARCSYFRLALLSGMRESRENRIDVLDTNPRVFGLFLNFLYSGCLDERACSNDDQISLLFLADRYDLDDLKSMCEARLMRNSKENEEDEEVEPGTALFLYSIADACGAQRLKTQCLSVIMAHTCLEKSDQFKQLSKPVQDELQNYFQWRTDANRASFGPGSSSDAISDNLSKDGCCTQSASCAPAGLPDSASCPQRPKRDARRIPHRDNAFCLNKLRHKYPGIAVALLTQATEEAGGDLVTANQLVQLAKNSATKEANFEQKCLKVNAATRQYL